MKNLKSRARVWRQNSNVNNLIHFLIHMYNSTLNITLRPWSVGHHLCTWRCRVLCRPDRPWAWRCPLLYRGWRTVWSGRRTCQEPRSSLLTGYRTSYSGWSCLGKTGAHLSSSASGTRSWWSPDTQQQLGVWEYVLLIKDILARMGQLIVNLACLFSPWCKFPIKDFHINVKSSAKMCITWLI